MNTNASAKTVLCFGDSNTYGQKPDKINRYTANVRWTGQLQNLLGGGYYLIEEGLGSRTTDLDYDKRPGRNGKTYLLPTLQSHNPLDIVIIMLGNNDLKMVYRRSASQIGIAIGELVKDVRQYGTDKQGNPPQIILVSPTAMNNEAPRFAEFYTGYYDTESVKESRELAGTLRLIAEEQSCAFIDAAQVAKAGEDGIHWDVDSQASFAVVVEKVIGSFDE